MTVWVQEAIEPLRKRLSESPLILWVFSLEATLLRAGVDGELRLDPCLTSFVAELADFDHHRVAVIGADTLPRMEKLLPDRRIILAGSNGLEYSGIGQEGVAPDLSKLRPALLRVLRLWRDAMVPIGGARIEDHGALITLHHPQGSIKAREVLMRAGMETIRMLGEGSPLEFVARGSCFHVRPRGFSRGSAVHRLFHQMEQPGAVVAMVGSQQDDEESFAALVGMPSVGFVVDGPCEIPGATHHLRPGESIAEAVGLLSAR